MQEFFSEFGSHYPFVAPLLFILLRSLGIIIPPIPGIFIDLVGIATFGWAFGFVYGEIGIMVGSMVAFWVGRLFREPALRYVAPLRRVHEWENKISENTKFWAFVLLRLLSSPAFDYVSYVAGLTKISARKYFWATLIGSIPIVFLIYYLGEIAFSRGLYYTLAFLTAIFVFWGVFSKIDFLKKPIR